MAKIKNRVADNHKTKPKGVNPKAFERVYWPYIPLVLLIGLLLTLGGRSGSLSTAARRPFGQVLSYSTSMSIDGLLSDTNTQRSANGVSGLSLNGKLDAAAQAKADDMAARNYWSHYTPEGNPPWVFVSNQGYSYQKIGENLAAGFSDEQSTINGWMASPPHRENLLDPAFTDVGFGFANNPDYTSAGGGPMTIVVAFYGKPQVLSATATAQPPTPPVASTPAQTVPAPAPAPTPTPPPPSPIQTKPVSNKQPATNTTPKAKIAPTASASRLQLAAPTIPHGGVITETGILAGLGIGLFWISRHLRALKKFLLEGEAYAIRHPLTDLGLIIVACLLFILSQTAGLIQ
jgi:hypothetical protein